MSRSEKTASARVVLPIPPNPCNITAITFFSLPYSKRSIISFVGSLTPTVSTKHLTLDPCL